MAARELDQRAVQEKADEQVLEDLLRELEPFLLSTASKDTHTYVTRQDDAWSVTLGAFQEAIASYSMDKGSFLSFLRLLIQRRLIDAYRAAGREPETIPLDTELGEELPEDRSSSQLQDEILSVTQQLLDYGIRFSDLVSQSPKAQKTKDACIQAVRYLCSQPLLLGDMRHSRTLPIKLIEKKYRPTPKNPGSPSKIYYSGG